MQAVQYTENIVRISSVCQIHVIQYEVFPRLNQSFKHSLRAALPVWMFFCVFVFLSTCLFVSDHLLVKYSILTRVLVAQLVEHGISGAKVAYW